MMKLDFENYLDEDDRNLLVYASRAGLAYAAISEVGGYWAVLAVSVDFKDIESMSDDEGVRHYHYIRASGGLEWELMKDK